MVTIKKRKRKDRIIVTTITQIKQIVLDDNKETEELVETIKETYKPIDETNFNFEFDISNNDNEIALNDSSLTTNNDFNSSTTTTNTVRTNRAAQQQSNDESNMKRKGTGNLCRFIFEDGTRCTKQLIKGCYCTMHGEGKRRCDYWNCSKTYEKIEEGKYRCRQHRKLSERCYRYKCESTDIISGTHFCEIHKDEMENWKI